ncbi:MAG: ZIP family metal transporter, partial [Candidatus Diapherotrites archaeon]
VVSLVGIVLLFFGTKFFDSKLFLLVSLAAGVLIGDAFIHLIPQAIELSNDNYFLVSLNVLAGFLLFLLIERLIHWHHFHGCEEDCEHEKSFGYMNLFSDAIHNFVDGVIIAVSYLASFPLGVATTIAVIFHEIPQELSDYGVLVAAGFSKFRALFFNFFSALFAVFGALSVFVFQQELLNSLYVLVALTAGGFIYISSTDLLPELHKNRKLSFSYILTFFLGVLLMYLLLFFE